MDFELGAKSAAMYVYPTIVPRLSQFHLSQSIMKKVKKEHLLNTYETDDEFKIAIRALAALPYLPLNLIRRGFQVLEQRCPDDAEPVYMYFKNTYIQTRRGREPRFPPVLWNQHDAVLVDLGRTNNALEAYNLNLKMHLTAYHPPLSRVIEVLKAEEDNTYSQMR
uniref:Uncharacterized protein n=1 Tax=Panagrolaimus sp. PS1159 TaxID=55785 RepID=A0AC35GXW7_9BILA